MKIVICDDQKYICEEVSLLCKEYFLKREEICEIYCCSSGKEYLECGIEPDILFLDIELGDMTGTEIADMTALGMKETYIIYISISQFKNFRFRSRFRLYINRTRYP